MNKTAIIITSTVVILGVVLAFVLTGNKPETSNSDTVTNAKDQRLKGDVNWDDKVDYLDSNIIGLSSGCKKEDSCWNKVVGKTVTGDNPIYASDLDLNGDGLVDDLDANLAK